MIQTLKSILARPAHTAALFVEIVIVTIIGWIAIEPVATTTTAASLSPGYDVDRLVMVRISQLSQDAEEFDTAYYNSVGFRLAKEQLLSMVRNRKETASATFTSWSSMGRSSSSTTSIEADSLYRIPHDVEKGEDKQADEEIIRRQWEDNYIQLYKVAFVPGSDFFKTFGIKNLNGDDFEEPAMTPGSQIITRTLAKAVCPNGKVTGKDLFTYDENDPEDHHSPIVAVTEDITYSKDQGRTGIAFQPIEWTTGNNGHFDAITIRIADRVNPNAFMDRLEADLSDLRCGNLYLSEPILYSDLQDELFARKQKELNRQWIILGFFLINVFLGIAGTFYVQCRTRIPAAGVMRAFGATRRRIELSIVGEAWLTVFIGWAIGSTLYLLYLHHQALPMKTDAYHVIQMIRPLWYDTPAGRYSVIGAIVLLILLLTATLGAWLPASRVGRVPIVDSLRDE